MQEAIQARSAYGGGRNQYAQAVQRQQVEIQRTKDYAASVGCGNPAFNDFDGSEPQQCGPIEARLHRMDDNLAQLQERQQQLDQDDGQRGQLVRRFNTYCSQQTPDNAPVIQDIAPDPSSGDSADLRTVPVDPDQPAAEPDGNIMAPEPSHQHVGQAICVRSCDGGYFPLGQNATQDQLQNLEQLCKVSCPNTEAHLYTMPRDGKLDDATAVDGQAYSALPAAFKFQKSYEPSCTCKPPGQSWVQALADAEKLLEQHRGDVTVTDKMSNDMARPKTTTLPAPQVKGKRKGDKPAGAAGAMLAPDDAAALEGLRGSQAPTASSASADIGPNPDAKTPVVGQGDGTTKQVKGPDGTKRAVRVIGP